MYDQLTAEGAFSFKNLASTYKFTVKDLDSRVKKVKFQIYNQTTYGLSGSWPFHDVEYIIDYNYATPGSAKSTLTYVNNVTDGQAVFYVSTRCWGTFQPVIKVYDADHDLLLKEFTAGTAKSPSSLKEVQRISLSVPTELPVAIVDGVIDEWDDIPAIAGNTTRILEWKYVSDEDNVYFLFKVDKAKISSGNWGSYIFTGFDNDNDSSTGADAGAGVTGGFEAMASVYPWRDNGEGGVDCFKGQDNQGTIACPVGTDQGHVTVAGAFDGDYCYIETCVPLALIGNPNGNITVKHGMNYYVTTEAVITVGTAAAEPKEATITAGDVEVKVGKTVNIGATTNSTAAIEYVSDDSSIATVTSDGTVTGVAAGSTTITLSVPAVEGKFTEATKSINVTVTEASTSIIDIDGDMSDWDNITTTFISERTDRIREWKYVSDADNVYFYFVLRKNRSCNKQFCIGFDWDETGAYTDNNNIKDCELLIKCFPFTNASGAQPVCVNGFDPQATINGTADASAVFAYDYDNGSDISSSSSNHYLEISIPRSKLNLPAAGTTINIAASLDYYETGFQTITLQ